MKNRTATVVAEYWARLGSAQLRLILVDFGGTLFDLLPVHISCFESASEQILGRRLTAGEAGRAANCYRLGDSTWTAIRAVFGKSLPSDILRDICRCKRDMTDAVISEGKLPSWSCRFLAECTACTRTAVLSIGGGAAIRKVLNGSGMISCIDVLGREHSCEDITKADLLVAATVRYRTMPEEVLLVGDTAADRTAAAAAGVWFVDVGELGGGFSGR